MSSTEASGTEASTPSLLARVDASVSTFLSRLEVLLPLLSVVCFATGLFVARSSPSFARHVSNAMETFIDMYGYVAPIAIYLILTPTLIKLITFGDTCDRRFALHTIIWFAKARLLACTFAAIATALIFGLPLYTATAGFTTAVQESVRSLVWMLTHSIYFYAVYASLITVVISLRFQRMAQFLARGVDLIEYLGKFIIPLVPLFMLSVGAYVTILPELIEEAVGTTGTSYGTISILGKTFDATSTWGMLQVYVMSALLTGVVCGFWHAGLLVRVKRCMPDFRLREYFTRYWLKIYPLLWATSSEALSTPFNLHLIKNLYPKLRAETRQFVVGAGSIQNINGTMINVFLMTGLVACLVGAEISLLQLLLAVPLVFLIGYGVPGIPGELLLFGGPICLAMGISPELTPVFLSVYIGLQIGLPDSFRTGANSTDECLCAIILDSHRERVMARQNQPESCEPVNS